MVPVRRRGAFFLLTRYRQPHLSTRVVLCLVCLLLLSGDCRSAGDLVARLYDLQTSGNTVAKLSLSSSALPSAISSRLSSYALTWSDLSGLMQRALLWDSGFVFSSPVGSSSSSTEGDDVKLVQIFTPCTQAMGDLLPDLVEVRTLRENISCNVENCGIIGHFLAKDCPVKDMIPLTRCAVYASDMAEQKQFSGVYWAEDGRSTRIPEPVLRRHSAVDTEASASLFAVHLSDATFVGTDSCQPHTDFILPCRGVTDEVEITSSSGSVSFTASSNFTEVDLCPAAHGAAMNAWLELVSAPSPETFSTTAIVLLTVAMSICVGLAISVWWLSRSRAWLQDAYDRVILEGSWEDGSWAPTSHLLGGPLAPSLAVAAATDEERLTPMEVFFGARPRSRRSPGIQGTSALVATTRAEITLSNDQLCRKSAILRGFVSDPAIVTKRISFAQLHFLRLLAKGGSGEVWLGQYETHYVAMKCLLPTKREDPEALEQFAEEIRMASLLAHPRIVAFCGVAWQSLLHLCAVTEYMPRGDLESLLANPIARKELSWNREKLTLSSDIVEALVYLHSLVPIVIHRDLKSKNVLLDRRLRAKLSDFGLSRERSVEDTMTNGIGTILWSAPEVLEGKRYDEKSDLFSFGVVLSEIDTCALPYGFSRHAKMRSMQIVHLVSEGKLLPNFREDCPPSIRDLAQRCLSLDPAARPTAMEVAFELRSSIAPQLLKRSMPSVADVDNGSIVSSASGLSTTNLEDAGNGLTSLVHEDEVTKWFSETDLLSQLVGEYEHIHHIHYAMETSNENDGSTLDTVRKARLIRKVPILVHVMKQGFCPEGVLLRALEPATYGDGEYIYAQGQPERDVYFIEEGKVLITQRRRSRASSAFRPVGFIPMDSSGGVVFARRSTRRRSQIEAEMEIQLHKHEELEYFGEESLLQGFVSRVLNAVASGDVTCFVLPEAAFARLLAPVHELMLHRHLLRMHGVLAKQRIFQHFSARQRQHLLDHCTIEHYEEGSRIIQQGDKDDDRYFILAEGEADVVLDELLRDLRRPASAGLPIIEQQDDEEEMGVRTSIICRKTIYQGFGEMGILCRPRTAHVVAAGNVICLAVSRKIYIGAAQLISIGGVDADAEALLAMSLIEEWALVVKTRNLHLANPLVSRYLETFVKKFKAAYMQKFEGKTLYLDLLRRINEEPTLAEEFPFVSDRMAWNQPTSSLSITRSETRRILSLPPAERSVFEINFVSRLLEPTAFIDKFDRPSHVDKLALARAISRYANFITVQKDKFLFRQGKIESRAFLILRGNISIVNEDVNTLQPGLALKQYDVLVTLPAGGSFGELSLVTRQPRSASALAACEADLLVFERAHLQGLMAQHPGVSIQHAMVERAEFLASLCFLRDSDFAQCIRVAHDLQVEFYEPRHIFLQEPVHLRSLYIVKSGEVVVYLRRNVPIADTTMTSAGNDITFTKEVLVRVATIGPQEFFGVAIANANMLTDAGATISTSTPGIATSPNTNNRTQSESYTSPTSLVPSPATIAQNYVAATFASVTSTNGSISSTNVDLAKTVFMCSTRVQILELSERGWRRLPLSSLQSIRNSLLERHRWNLETVEKHQNQNNPTYFMVDKPWQPMPISATQKPNDDTKDTQTRILEPLPTTQLARRLKDKKHQQQQQGHNNAVSKLFTPAPLTPTKPYQPGRLSISTFPIDRPGTTLSSRESHISGKRPLKTSAGSATFAQENFLTPMGSPFQSPSHATQLGGSFQPENASVAFFTQPSCNTPRILSPRPPAIMSPTGNPSPRRASSDAKHDTLRTPQTTNDCKAMWKLQRKL
ncbi:Protein kinase [Phytophthora megakarya]|uniref:Protein kinase n=1 Tax=Phytophthora megakarya TaxID=4795 RepID=A0A225WZ83_9STRA|nr:Protein kinase [Phytophthora megakarya]